MDTVSGKLVKPRKLDKKGTDTLMALLSSKTKKAAIDKLSITYQTLYDRIERYGLHEIIAQVPKNALQTLQLGSEAAAETMVSKLQGHQGLDAAKEILDRVGVGVKKESNVAVQVNNFLNNEKNEFNL